MAKRKVPAKRHKLTPKQVATMVQDATDEAAANGEDATQFIVRKIGDTQLFGWTISDLFKLFQYAKETGVGPSLVGRFTGF